jgi:hypothetical protein
MLNVAQCLYNDAVSSHAFCAREDTAGTLHLPSTRSRVVMAAELL